MKTQFLKNKLKWTAFTTINGLDVNELGSTEKQAKEKLAKRIRESDFLLDGIKLPTNKK